MGQSLAIPRVIPNDWKRLDLIVNKIKMRLGSISSPTFAGITVTGLTASTLIGANASKALESVTVGTGLDYTRPNLTLSHLGIEALTDPGADRIFFWDDSETACKWLTVSTGLQISTTNLTTKDSEIVHDNLSGFSADKHVAHSGVTLTAGTGLTGGGDITANRSFAVDGVLEDLDTLGAAASDGQFIVATGTGVFAYESGATARASLGAPGNDTEVVFNDGGVLGASNKLVFNKTTGIVSHTGNVYLLTQSSMFFYDADSTHYARFSANPTTTTSIYYYLPAANGSAGDVLSTDGSNPATLSWVSGGVGGSDKYIQYNSSGAFAGDSSLYWDYGTTPKILHITGNIYIHATSGTVGELRFYDGASSDYVGFKAPAATALTSVWALPAVDGTAGQHLKTDGSFALGWGQAVLTTSSPTFAGLKVESEVFIKEQAAADTDQAGYGQVWIKNTTPNELWFTDDVGADVQLGVVSVAFSSKCSVYINNTQAITTGTWTKILLDTEDYDGDSEFDSTTNYRFSPDVTGYYHVSAGVQIQGLADGKEYFIGIYKNGSVWKASGNTPGAPTGSSPIFPVTCDMYLLNTDYIELWIYHGHGSNRDVGSAANRYTFMDVHRFA